MQTHEMIALFGFAVLMTAFAGVLLVLSLRQRSRPPWYERPENQADIERAAQAMRAGLLRHKQASPTFEQLHRRLIKVARES